MDRDIITDNQKIEGFVMMLYNLDFYTFYQEDITIIAGVLEWGPNYDEDDSRTL